MHFVDDFPALKETSVDPYWPRSRGRGHLCRDLGRNDRVRQRPGDHQHLVGHLALPVGQLCLAVSFGLTIQQLVQRVDADGQGRIRQDADHHRARR